MAERKLLPNIVFTRLLLIFLLVVHHSFNIYSGSWTEPEGFKSISAYWWISKFSICFLLELFVFISGYLFAYQIIGLKKFYIQRNYIR